TRRKASARLSRRSRERLLRRDKRGSLRKLGPHRRGVLAEGRHLPGRPLLLEHPWGGWQPNRALWGLDRDPPEMRMMGKILDRIEIAEGDFGGFQTLGECGARMAREL